jgi:succinoglycan biosynthesis protein ExoO
MSVDVSVIIPAWKAAGFIGRAIESALMSAGVSVEVVAVDDASPDGTFETLKALALEDRRIVIDRLPKNGGPSAARNRAIELATGRFIAILDADDAVAPGRLAQMMALADKSNADIIVDNMVETDETGRQMGNVYFLKSAEFAQRCEIDLATWIHFNQPMKQDVECIGYLKPLIRRAKLAEAGVRYDEALRNSEDYYLVADLLAAGARMTYTPEAGYLYQRSSSSTSFRLQPQHTKAWLEAEKRFAARHGNRFTGKEQAALAQRIRQLRNVDQFVSAVDVVKAKKLGGMVKLLASDVQAAGYTISTFSKIALGKVLKRKLV